ncbi:MAG: hypothetical protein WA964_17910 [Ilumatobacter sp.]|uniref:hypothetical protein n=1 Tax=Ilumatobacter sp. TaxID=1967498 RepID=UPI003C73E613
MPKTVLPYATAVALAAAATLITGPAAVADSVEPSARTCFGVAGSPADAAIVNLTPVGAVAAGNGQLVSSDTASPPVFSNVNYTVGSIDPNIAIARIGTDGDVCFVNNGAGRVGLVADHLGTIDATAYTPATAGGAPTRTVDTRTGLGGSRLGPGARLCFGVAGAPGDAAVVNLTPVRAAGTGDGKLVSSDTTSPPVFSNVNYTVGSVDPNIAIARIGTDGQVCYVNADETSVDLAADHIGTVAAASYTPATAGGAPTRAVDTRTSVGGTRLGSGARLCFGVAGTPGDAAVVNLTPVRAAGTGNGQLVSSDALNPPVFSNANYRQSSVDPNVAIAPIGADGQVCFVNNGATGVDLIADHIGTIAAAAYTPATADGSPDRVLDSRETASRADLVLDVASVGAAGFSREDADTVRYFTSGLGSPISDESQSFPVPSSSGLDFETTDGFRAFAFQQSRELCWDNGFCATFGGRTVADLAFVGWNQDSRNPAVTPLRTSNGVTIGSRGSDFPDGFEVDNGGCFTFGFGTTNGVGVGLLSDGVPFGEVRPGGEFVFNTPPLSDVVVQFLFSGDAVIDLEGDC